MPTLEVEDELDAGVQVEVAQLPDPGEIFSAIDLARRVPHPLPERVLSK